MEEWTWPRTHPSPHLITGVLMLALLLQCIQLECIRQAETLPRPTPPSLAPSHLFRSRTHARTRRAVMATATDARLLHG
uniref:Secreted protein n=1 Tax=Hordeum vulgare subsp. vulgare TaxID=112509 RepID=A0A8I6XXM2_HORVV